VRLVDEPPVAAAEDEVRAPLVGVARWASRPQRREPVPDVFVRDDNLVDEDG
jgi:hypothetical protein